MPETKIADALGAPRTHHFAGRDWNIKPLTFNSLVKIERRFGSLDNIPSGNIESTLALTTIILQTDDPSLKEEQVGELLTFKNLSEASAFIAAVFEESGLANTLEKKEATSGAD